MTLFSIIPASTESDWQQAKELLEELLAFENVLRPQRKSTDKVINSALRYVRQNITEQNGLCLLALDHNNQAIGFMNGWIENGDGLDQGDNRLGYISDAYIKPEFRNAFLFKQIGKEMAAHFLALGISRLSFDTLGNNTRMQRLFIRFGFMPHKVIFQLEIDKIIT